MREVEAGEEYVITRKGEPVARLAPIPGRRVLTLEQQAAPRPSPHGKGMADRGGSARPRRIA